LIYKLTYQHVLVIAAITTGVYSYLSIGKDIETEVAVQDGLKVLENVGSFERFVFAVYNITVLIYYHKLLVHKFKSGWNYILSVIFCKWCRTSDDQRIETTFKPTWNSIHEIYITYTF